VKPTTSDHERGWSSPPTSASPTSNGASCSTACAGSGSARSCGVLAWNRPTLAKRLRGRW